MPIRYFAWCNNLVDTILYNAEGVTKVADVILRDTPKLILNCGRPTIECRRTGNGCSPACRKFDPDTSCRYSALDAEYNTLAQAFWLFRSSRHAEQQHWDAFYSCFHEKPRGDKTKRFVKKFPNDVALIDADTARSMYQTGHRYHTPDRPSKWNEERLAAVSGTDLEHRMASTDWDWHWYHGCIRKKLQVSMAQAAAKVELDRLMHKLYGDEYESTGTYTVNRADKEFAKIENLYRQVKPLLDIQIEFITSK